MKSVDIFTIVYGFDYFLLRNMRRQRKLHYEAVDIIVAVKYINGFKKTLLSDIRLKPYKRGLEPTLLAGPTLRLRL